jgi:hypothetical protein
LSAATARDRRSTRDISSNSREIRIQDPKWREEGKKREGEWLLPVLVRRRGETVLQPHQTPRTDGTGDGMAGDYGVDGALRLGRRLWLQPKEPNGAEKLKIDDQRSGPLQPLSDDGLHPGTLRIG